MMFSMSSRLHGDGTRCILRERETDVPDQAFRDLLLRELLKVRDELVLILGHTFVLDSLRQSRPGT